MSKPKHASPARISDASQVPTAGSTGGALWLSAAQEQLNDRGEINALVPCLALRRAALKGATSSPNGEHRGSHGGVNPCKRTQSNNHRVCDRWPDFVTSQHETRERIAVIDRALSPSIVQVMLG